MSATASATATAMSAQSATSSATARPAVDPYLVQQINQAAVSIAQGKKPQAVYADLVNQGIHPPAAGYIVAEAEKMKHAAFRKGGVKILMAGIGYLVLGTVITGITLSMAHSAGGFFVVTTGLFFVGIVNVFRGLGRMIAG